MGCRPGHHDWEMISVEQEGREVQLRRCGREGCGRWDELKGAWTVLSVPAEDDEVDDLVVA
jgi:hypothetical protein